MGIPGGRSTIVTNGHTITIAQIALEMRANQGIGLVLRFLIRYCLKALFAPLKRLRVGPAFAGVHFRFLFDIQELWPT